jgi:diguanylate cyclase (GGDEF)-like protein
MAASQGENAGGDPFGETTRMTVEPSNERQKEGPLEGSLVIIYGPNLGRRYPLDRRAMELGRDDNNTICIHSDKASRRHARVVERDGQVWIEDLGSTNGTIVNDRKVRQAPLSHGDIVNIGSVLLKYICGGDPEALYHEEIYQITITDNLTGLRNQRYLFEFIDGEVSRAIRHERPLSLAIFDIDKFKDINDTHGHLAGDLVLRRLPRAVASNVRREELLARFGGDEFALVMPETDMDEACIFAERIRSRVEQSAFDFDGTPLHVTLSMGVATLPLAEEHDANAFFKLADDALYRAKDRGRNSIATTAD